MPPTLTIQGGLNLSGHSSMRTTRRPALLHCGGLGGTCEIEFEMTARGAWRTLITAETFQLGSRLSLSSVGSIHASQASFERSP